MSDGSRTELGHSRVAVIIPVLDEEAALPLVLGELPNDLVDDIVVVDNGSTDRSVDRAREAGARVVHEPQRGYGAACLAGIAATPSCDIVVFMDGDHSDFPEDLRDLLQPLRENRADLVIGSRMSRPEARAALPPQARFGNWLAALLLRCLFGVRCTDLGPFRVIRRDALLALGMNDRDFGWTIEMQLRARLTGLRVLEVPVRYRRRIGTSKISGTVRGTLLAGWKILSTLARFRLCPPRICGRFQPRLPGDCSSSLVLSSPAFPNPKSPS